jgi:hypothetical protein
MGIASGGGRRNVISAGPSRYQRLDPIRILRRYRGSELTALRGTEQAKAAGSPPHRRPPLPPPPVERQVYSVPVRQAAPGLVIADHGKPLSQTLDEAAEGEQLQLPAQMGDPARIAQW